MGIASAIHDTFYMCGLYTDHSAFFLGLEPVHIDRGPGFWKLNTLLLHDVDLLNQLKMKVQRVKEEYSRIEPKTKWVMIKDAIRETCQEYSKASAQQDKIARAQLTEYMAEAEDDLEKLDKEQMELLEVSKQELEQLQLKRTMGLIFRSKVRWYAKGEINTKYFYNLECARYNAKTCTSVYDNDNILQTSPEKILQTQQIFYEELYTSDPQVEYNLHINIDSSKQACEEGISEEHFTIQELADAVRGLKNGSCPGPDGIPVEVYKILWADIPDPLHEMVIQTHEDSIFHKSIRKGVLNLIPKGNKDMRYLKNMRPITLLNCDYKVVEKNCSK